MSCYNCYTARKLDEHKIDSLLERGNRLRNAMVQTILKNDPLNSEVIYSQANLNHNSVKVDDLSQECNNKIRAFLQGNIMSKEDEIATLETLRSMSATDLCRVTDKTYRSNGSCNCPTCLEYREKDLNCDLKRVSSESPAKSVDTNEVTHKIQEQYKTQAANYLKYVDSLKVCINCLILNNAGDKRVLANDKASNVSQTFFIEYQIPTVLFKTQQRSKSKVDSGLDLGHIVRLCARRSFNQEINFKQVSIHDIGNLVDLHEIVLKFRLSYRNFRQKQPVPLGYAEFNFDSFQINKNLTCHQELSVKLDENTPLVLGGLRVTLQLGCGRLYFGKEFIDAMNNKKENSTALGSDDWSNSFSNDRIEKSTQRSGVTSSEKIDNSTAVSDSILTAKKSDTMGKNCESVMEKLKETPPKNQSQNVEVPKSPSVISKSRLTGFSSNRSERSKNSIEKFEKSLEIMREVGNTCILFGFIYIAEAQFSREVLNSFITCQMFGQDECSMSKLVAFDSNPIYNFHQQIPLVYNDSLLFKLRDNYMVVEFWEKDQDRDFIIGLSKLSLHQFYLAFRNQVIVKYLENKTLPVIGTDGWEPIYNPDNAETVGQVQVLVALGTKEQIDNLQQERGFKKTIVKAKLSPPQRLRFDKNIEKAKKSLQIEPERDLHPLRKVDIGTQSEMEPDKDKTPDNIETLLNQLIAQKPRNIHVETGTNTNPLELESPTKSTSHLLDTLQMALSVDIPKDDEAFKAHIAINSALHLPSRKKCKSRKSRGKNVKHEDILPSTYVTFECFNGDVRITPIIPKNTNPKWDFRCEATLSVEYLTNNQKCLIFKVWRKSTNTNMTPNMQTDVIIGCASVDLTVLSSGLPSVQGWFNINDLSHKCHGQINVHVTPLEDIGKYRALRAPPGQVDVALQPQTSDLVDEPGELLGRALKRKFTELDEITQRLRLRLSKVTNDESDAITDEVADEFERDINTLCVEDDFDTVDFEKEARSFNLNHTKDVGLLQADSNSQCLMQDKQKIDTLLEKLSLFSAENSSRYVSGCSNVQLDAETILNDLDHHSRPNLHSSSSFNRDMALKFGESYTSESSSEVSQGRTGPEGEGSFSDDSKVTV